MLKTFKSDIEIIKERDPAARGILEIFLCYPGFQSIVIHRLTHKLWKYKLPLIPRLLSHLNRLFTGIEIHPAAKIGGAVMIDHATGVVIGETCEIESEVSIFQGVTLGGKGFESGKRHPNIKKGASIFAASTILGDITIGEGAIVAAGSLVLKDVPENTTVAGVPAKIIS